MLDQWNQGKTLLQWNMEELDRQVAELPEILDVLQTPDPLKMLYAAQYTDWLNRRCEAIKNRLLCESMPITIEDEF